MNATEKFNIIHDQDKNIRYETNSVVKNIFNLFFIPILSLVPTNMRGLLRRTHDSGGEIIDKATTHAACEVLYQRGHQHKKGEPFFKKVFRIIWMNMSNSKAIRNRLRLTEREIENKILGLATQQKHIRLLSIAAGSSRGIVEVLQKVSPYLPEDVSLDIVFLDKSTAATEYSQRLVSQSGLNYNFSWVNNNAGAYLRENLGQKFDIIEMVGLMDYFTDEKVVNIFRDILNTLSQGGVVITANIMDNKERPFLTRAVGWDMIYRTAEGFASLIKQAGFSRDKMKVFVEPLKIHCIVVAEK